MRRRPKQIRRFQREDEHRINERIRVAEIRLVPSGPEDDVTPDVYPTETALQMAKDRELDLVEISPKATPPVCKIIDYKKFLYEKKRRDKEIKSKTQKTVIKEIRFTPNTDDHDFEFKAKHALRFLQDGAKVKAYVQFKGRMIMFKDRGELILLKFAQRVEDFGQVEQLPKLEGKRMIMFVAPKKKGK